LTPIEVIDAHTPSLSKENEWEMLAMTPPHKLDSDVANFAIRTCACGLRIDGFYEYVSHLKDEMRKADVASP